MILNSPIISGSLTVTGNILTSGSITLSGSIASASFASTASFVALAQSASNAVSAATASFANAFTVAGNLTAQTLVVQTITSSVDFVTGSTRFGSVIGNTHNFTGSVSISGSLSGVGATFSNNIIAGGSTDDTSGGLYSNIALNNSTYSRYSLLTGGTARARFQFDGTNTSLTTTSTGGKLQLATFGASAMEFFTNDALKMTITSGGDVFINNSSGVSLNSLTNKLSISSTTYNLLDISRFSDNAFGPNFYLVKSRNGTIGGNTIVANGDNLGNITWVGATGGTGLTDAANIRTEVDGTPGTGDMPGRLVFSTTADGASSTTERIRITNNGNIIAGYNQTTSNTIGRTFATSHASGNRGATLFYGITDGGNGGMLIYNVASSIAGHNSQYISFETHEGGVSTGERMRITSGGVVNIGSTSGINLGERFNVIAYSLSAPTLSRFFVNVSGALSTSAARFDKFDNNSTTSQVFIDFTINNQSAGNGSITANGANQATFTSWSDRRLKENITNLPSQLSNIMALRPVEFDYKDGSGHQIGFIAQEVQEVYSDIVGENAEGYLTISGLGKMESRLIKAIQELKAQNDDLQSQINELKAQ